MVIFSSRRFIAAVVLGFVAATGSVNAEEVRLKPYILGNPVSGDMAAAVSSVKGALKAQGFEEAGSYSPYPGATVIVVTSPDLKSAAARVKNGGFGAGQRVAVTERQGQLQVSYVNPAYIGAAYGMGKLESVSSRLMAALGAVREFGSEAGLTADELAPGTYHYMVGMPYFHQIDLLAEHGSFSAAVAAVEKGLAAGNGGTKKVYRIDLPGKEVSVFGVAVVTGDGVSKGDKDTDKEVMDIVDWQPLRHTAYLPYEILVQGGVAIALRGRYRIALHFPDTKMSGAHGFTKIMSSPGGIKAALKAVAESGKKEK